MNTNKRRVGPYNVPDVKGDLARLHALHGQPSEENDGNDAGLIQDLSDDPDAADYEQYRYQRRRSRAVLYHLSGSYDKTKNTKTKIQLNKVTYFQRFSL